MTNETTGVGVDHNTFVRARNWLVDTALPFWARVGREASGGFHERLNVSGLPDLAAPRRAMVQARQIAVFSLAHERGWRDARPIVEPALDRLLAIYDGQDGRPGWLFSVDAGGDPVDSRRDAYTHAFILFALAWAQAVVDDEQLTALAELTLAAMDALMAEPAGGYRDGDDAPAAPLRQNPQMHLFEALLALAERTGKAEFRQRADALFTLCETRFFQPGAGVLCERFETDWGAPALADMVWEPGHHFEWVWLLRRYAALSGVEVSHLTGPLYDTALAAGVDAEGLVIDERAGDGRMLNASRRCWPQCEAIKAHAAEHEAGRPGSRQRAEAGMRTLLDRYLVHPVPGAWIEHLDPEGQPMRQDVPASTLYHLAFAIAEADRVFSAG